MGCSEGKTNAQYSHFHVTNWGNGHFDRMVNQMGMNLAAVTDMSGDGD